MNDENNNIIIRYNNNNDVITKRDIMSQLEIACYNHGLENGLNDLRECPTAKFTNILGDIGAGLFKPTRALYRNEKSYDLKKIDILCGLYIDICNEYDKRIYDDAFYKFCGLGQRYLEYKYTPTTNDDGLNPFFASTRKRLLDADGALQSDKARDSKTPILQLAYNNYKHNWNGQIKTNELKATARTLNDIRENREKLTDSKETRAFGLIQDNNE